MPEVSAVHTNTALTDLAIGYPTQDFISERLLATVLVRNQSDLYYIFDTARRAVSAVDDVRAPGTAPRRVDVDVTTGVYTTAGHALRVVVPDEERVNADLPIQPAMDKTDCALGELMTNQEIGLKVALDAALTGGQTSDPTNEWDDYTSGDPFADVHLAINTIEDATGFRPNVMAMDSKVWRALSNHPDIIERVVGMGSSANPAQAYIDSVAGLFDLEEIIVGNALKNTAVQGQTASLSRIWGSDVYVAYRSNRPGLKVPSMGYRFVWTPFSGGLNGWRVTEFRDDTIHSDVIDVERYYDQKITLATAGYRLQNRLG